MDSQKYIRLVSKYAILLAASYVVEFVPLKLMDWGYLGESMPVRSLFISLFSILLNCAFGYLIYLDIKKLKVKADYSVLATILYRPVGIFVFLIYCWMNQHGRTQDL